MSDPLHEKMLAAIQMIENKGSCIEVACLYCVRAKWVNGKLVTCDVEDEPIGAESQRNVELAKTWLLSLTGDDEYDPVSAWRQAMALKADAIICVDAQGGGHLVAMFTREPWKEDAQSQYDSLPDTVFSDVAPGLYYANMTHNGAKDDSFETDWEVGEPVHQIHMPMGNRI